MSKNNLWLIYRITNLIDEGYYIGVCITTRYAIRMYQHSICKNNECPKFYNAIRKYGWENFKCDILSTDVPESIIPQVENCFIRYYKFYRKKKIYNLKDISFPHSNSMESRKKMSKNNARYMLGRKDIECFNSLKIFQINPETGKTVKKWNSSMEASRILGLKQSNISKAGNGIRKSAGGFVWVYGRDYFKKNVLLKISKMYENGVTQIDKNTNKIIKKWMSGRSAGIELGIPYQNIFRACNSVTKTAGGFKWKRN